ncbi:MAG TPA: hypothetical protein VK154_09350 [Chitinophagales bacterium]|nr:hypothetical protein [Chitinophagales bacterium]
MRIVIMVLFQLFLVSGFGQSNPDSNAIKVKEPYLQKLIESEAKHTCACLGEWISVKEKNTNEKKKSPIYAANGKELFGGIRFSTEECMQEKRDSLSSRTITAFTTAERDAFNKEVERKVQTRCKGRINKIIYAKRK